MNADWAGELAKKIHRENAMLRKDVQLKDEALRKKSRTIGALRKAKREADAQLRIQLITIERLARQVIELQNMQVNGVGWDD